MFKKVGRKIIFSYSWRSLNLIRFRLELDYAILQSLTIEDGDTIQFSFLPITFFVFLLNFPLNFLFQTFFLGVCFEIGLQNQSIFPVWIGWIGLRFVCKNLRSMYYV